jgi:hypothetical protein
MSQNVAVRRGLAGEIFAEARSIRRAIRLLDNRRDMTYLYVTLPSQLDPARDLRLLPDFVAALERHGRLGFLEFTNASFDDDVDGTETPRSHDLERLFGVVLPNLPRFKFLNFDTCALHPRWLQLFLSSMPAGRRGSFRLFLIRTPLPRDSCQAIASAISRGVLGRLIVADARLDPASCTRLVQSAAKSRDLLQLTVGESPGTLTITEDMWADGAMSKATIRVLSFGAGWTDGGLVELFRQLRANVSLEFLDIRKEVSKERLFELLEELLSAYNFTIEQVGDNNRLPSAHRRRIDALLRRNQGVRTMNRQLMSRNYHVGEPRLWPRVLHDIGAFPTLVYRFLRQGNAVSLADQLRSRSGRRRRPPDR